MKNSHVLPASWIECSVSSVHGSNTLYTYFGHIDEQQGPAINDLEDVLTEDRAAAQSNPLLATMAYQALTDFPVFSEEQAREQVEILFVAAVKAAVEREGCVFDDLYFCGD